jgi:hypothetical protein
MASGKMRRTEKDFASQKQQLVDGRRKSGQLAICGNAFLDMTGAATAKARKNELNGERLSSYEQRIIDGKGDDSEPRIAGPTNVSPEPWRVPMQCASATPGLARPQRPAPAVGSTGGGRPRRRLDQWRLWRRPAVGRVENARAHQRRRWAPQTRISCAMRSTICLARSPTTVWLNCDGLRSA